MSVSSLRWVEGLSGWQVFGAILLTAVLIVAGKTGVQSVRSLGKNVPGVLVLSPSQAHRGRVVDAAWRSDGTRVASLGTDGRLIVWDARQFSPLAEYRLDPFGSVVDTNTVSWQPGGDMIVLTVKDKVVFLDAGSGELTSWLVGSTAAWRPDGTEITVGRSDGTIYRVVDYAKMELVIPLEQLSHGAVTDLAWTPQSGRLAVATKYQDVHLHTGGDLGLVYAQQFSRPVRALTWLDGGKLATLSGSGSESVVHLWRPSSPTPRVILQHAMVNNLDANPDGRRLVMGGTQLIVAEAGKGHVVFRSRALEDPITVVSWSPDGATLFSGAEDGSVRFWSVVEMLERAVR